MLRALLLSLLMALPARAATCHGQNLIAALPPADLATLKAEAEVPFARGNLWRATKDGQTIVLVGTYHLNDPRLDAMLATLAPYLDDAKALLVEAGPQEEEALKSATARDPTLMFLTSGPTLPERLPAADWALLSDALRARGMAPFMAAKMQPWLVATFLDMPACQFPIDADAAQGLDKRLIAAAQSRGLPVQALEPYDAVIKIFAQFTAAEQMAMLRQTIAMDQSSDDMATTLAESYFAGESRLFWAFTARVMLGQPGMTAQTVQAQMDQTERILITTRNAAWIPVLQAAAAKGPVLAAFGALHLPGAAGVLNLLAKEGWTITALNP